MYTHVGRYIIYIYIVMYVSMRTCTHDITHICLSYISCIIHILQCTILYCVYLTVYTYCSTQFYVDMPYPGPSSATPRQADGSPHTMSCLHTHTHTHTHTSHVELTDLRSRLCRAYIDRKREREREQERGSKRESESESESESK